MIIECKTTPLSENVCWELCRYKGLKFFRYLSNKNPRPKYILKTFVGVKKMGGQIKGQTSVDRPDLKIRTIDNFNKPLQTFKLQFFIMNLNEFTRPQSTQKYKATHFLHIHTKIDIRQKIKNGSMLQQLWDFLLRFILLSEYLFNKNITF